MAVRVGVLDSMSYRMVSMKDPDLGFYELCLRLEEKIEELSQGRFGRRRAMIGHLDSILYHRRYCLPKEESDPAGKNRSEEEQFARAQACLKKELAEGRFLTGASAKYVTLKEDMLLRRAAAVCCGRGQTRIFTICSTTRPFPARSGAPGRGVKIWRLRRTVWCL